jgi:hypothetical protein
MSVRDVIAKMTAMMILVLVSERGRGTAKKIINTGTMRILKRESLLGRFILDLAMAIFPFLMFYFCAAGGIRLKYGLAHEVVVKCLGDADVDHFSFGDLMC